LPLAKNVSESFLLHNPSYTFHIFLTNKIDEKNIDFSDERIKVHFVDDLGIIQFNNMQQRYTLFEYCNALKAFLANWLIDHFSIEHLIYTDSDMMFFNKISVVENCLKEYHIILTPHILSPIDIDGNHYKENDFLNAGLYNAGFFALRNTPVTKRFLDWWMERMESLSVIDHSRGLFVDQIWLNFVPLFFDGVYILKDPSYNMGPWNLTERVISPDTLLVNHKFPLVCYHFSGFDISSPKILSDHQSRYSFENRADLQIIYELYRNKLIEFGLNPDHPKKDYSNKQHDMPSLYISFKINVKKLLSKFRV
jgi:hypothetical protein